MVNTGDLGWGLSPGSLRVWLPRLNSTLGILPATLGVMLPPAPVKPAESQSSGCLSIFPVSHVAFLSSKAAILLGELHPVGPGLLFTACLGPWSLTLITISACHSESCCRSPLHVTMYNSVTFSVAQNHHFMAIVSVCHTCHCHTNRPSPTTVLDDRLGTSRDS